MSKTRLGMGLVGWLLASFFVAWFASRFDPDRWFAQLSKPAWTPPDRAFGLLEIVFYPLMAIAAWLIWQDGGMEKQRGPLLVFCLQLLCFGAWSWLLFCLDSPGLAVLDSVFLLALLGATGFLFWQRRPTAGCLLAPSLVWAFFLVALSISISLRNA